MTSPYSGATPASASPGYAEPTPQLREQAAVVADELSREGDAR